MSDCCTSYRNCTNFGPALSLASRAGPGLQGRVYMAYILLDNDSGMQPGRRAPSIVLSSLISLLTACL